MTDVRVAVVAGPDPGHAFPAVALALRLRNAGADCVLFTGNRWLSRVTALGLEAQVLPMDPPGGADLDAGARLHGRAAGMSDGLLAPLRAWRPDVVVADVLTAAGGLTAERLGVPWAELSPHPLYLPSLGLPPVGSGLAPGIGVRGRARDQLLRAFTARSLRQGAAHRAAARATIGLPSADPGPALRLVATLPALEVPRPDWPPDAHVVGPLVWDSAETDLAVPPGDGPLVLVSPSTAAGGTLGLLDAALSLRGVRLVGTVLGDRTDPSVHTDVAEAPLPPWATVGVGRQDPLVAQARVIVSGGGHGMLAKALLAGVPMVLVPGGGDQKELAARAERQGCAVVVHPLTPEALAAAVREVLADPAYAAAARRAAATSAEVTADSVTLIRALSP